jgi:hypothetical protein
MATPGVSVYVLRERLQESWEKRENLRLREEEILREVVGDTPLPAIGNRTLYEVALDAVVEGTQGYETLQGWRSKYLQRDA